MKKVVFIILSLLIVLAMGLTTIPAQADTTDPVLLLLPADGAVAGTIIDGGKARVVLGWEHMTGANWYEYQVALDEDFGTIIADASGNTEGQVVAVDLLLGKTYWWRVRVIDPLVNPWSAPRSFTTPLGPGSARPLLVSPEAGQIGIALQPVLEWIGLVDATNYELEVAEDCDFGNLVIEQTTGTETIYKVTSDLDFTTVYCWRVRAISQNTESPWSDTSVFTTIGEPTKVKFSGQAGGPCVAITGFLGEVPGGGPIPDPDEVYYGSGKLNVAGTCEVFEGSEPWPWAYYTSLTDTIKGHGNLAVKWTDEEGTKHRLFARFDISNPIGPPDGITDGQVFNPEGGLMDITPRWRGVHIAGKERTSLSGWAVIRFWRMPYETNPFDGTLMPHVYIFVGEDMPPVLELLYAGFVWAEEELTFPEGTIPEARSAWSSVTAKPLP